MKQIFFQILSVIAIITMFGSKVIYAQEKPLFLHGESTDEIKGLEDCKWIGENQLVPGRIGKGFFFSSSALLFPYAKVINPSAGTIEMWVKNDGFETVQPAIRIMFYAYYGDNQLFCSEIAYFESRPQVTSLIRKKGENGKYDDSVITFFPNEHGWKRDDWHFLTWTWGSGRFKFYVDGVLFKSVESAGPLRMPYDPGFSIGGCPTAVSNQPPGNGFHGCMDEVVVLKSERKAGSILNDYKYGFNQTDADDQSNKGKLVINPVFTSKPPKIDGNIFDDCWKDSSIASPFFLPDSDTLAPSQTQAYLLYDTANLYIAFKCAQDMSKATPAHGGEPWHSDHVELFIAPGAETGKYFQIAVDCSGTSLYTSYNTVRQTDGNISFDDTWKPAMKVATCLTEAGFYTIEMSIPISSFLSRMKSNFAPNWGINFCRDAQNPHFWSSWSKVVKGYNEPDSFGVLTGIGKTLTGTYSTRVDSFAIASLDTLHSILTLRISNLLRQPRKLQITLSFMGQKGESVGGLNKIVELFPQEIRTLTIPFTLSQRGPVTYRLDVDDPEKRVAIWSSGIFFAVIPNEVVVRLVEPCYRNTIFAGHTSPTVKGTLELNLQADEITGASGTITLRDPDGTQKHSAQIKPSRKTAFTIDISRFTKHGSYEIAYVVQTRSGRILRGKRTVNYLPSISGECTVDSQGFLAVDGKRFFPIGAFALSVAIDKGWLTPLDKGGFNTTVDGLPGNVTELAEKYKAFDLKFISYIDRGYKCVHDNDMEKLRRIMSEANSKCPSLLGYASGDEILNAGVSKDTMDETYRIISTADPYHTVTYWENWPNLLIQSYSGVDFASLDEYPIAGRMSLRSFYESILQGRNVTHHKPIVMVGEMLEASQLAGLLTPKNYEHVEALAFTGLVAKVRGLIWFGAHYANRQRFQWTCDLQKNRIVPIVPILLTDDLTEEAQSLTSSLLTLSKKYDGKYYVLAVNSEEKGIEQVEIRLPSKWKATSALEFYTRKPVVLKNGSLKDTFPGPFGVKVYEIKTR